MNPSNFFTELKRRNVYKVAAAYAVVAWLLLQALSILLSAFEAPVWVLRIFIAAIATGFPLALIFAWAFELTQEGIKRTEEVEIGKSIRRKTGRKLIAITASLALVALSLLLFQFIRARGTAQSSAAKPAAIPEKSVAVLPFENLSGDPSNAYFSDGIQEEILTRLAKIGDLKVISRTSTQAYKSRPANLRDIAQQLGVSHVLEGSVQRSADQVRVTVQLVNALNDSHLWAETYDRKLIDVFQVESDVAQKIAGSLEAKLTGREMHEITAGGTKNPQAYDAYLHALALFNKQGTERWKK